MQTFATQSPDDRRQVTFEGSGRLDVGDSIELASVNLFAVPNDLILEDPATAGATVTAWVRGGSATTAYTLTCIAQSLQGRIVVLQAAMFVGPVGLDTGG